MGVVVHDAIAERRCDVLRPVVTNGGERLSGCAVGPAAEVGKDVREPAVVVAILRGEAGDRITQSLFTVSVPLNNPNGPETVSLVPL